MIVISLVYVFSLAFFLCSFKKTLLLSNLLLYFVGCFTFIKSNQIKNNVVNIFNIYLCKILLQKFNNNYLIIFCRCFALFFYFHATLCMLNCSHVNIESVLSKHREVCTITFSSLSKHTF